MSIESTAPLPVEVAHLKPRDSLGAIYFFGCLLLTFAGIALAVHTHLLLWLTGQVFLALALVQWFVLLHECGHGVLFRSRRWDDLAGHVAGAFSFIPFHAWTAIHNQHHQWTGWQDLDPTTATLVPREQSRAERLLMNVCWRLWIPIFVLVYRINNFWNWPRLKRLFPAPPLRKRIAASVMELAVLYAGVVIAFGAPALLRSVGVGILLSMIFIDSLILSQHTHIPMKVSGNELARPFSARDQEVFTRSLRFPRWFSQWILANVDAHELHHIHPQIPGYLLSRVDYQPKNIAVWWRWILAARRLPAEVFMFQNRDESGSEV